MKNKWFYKVLAAVLALTLLAGCAPTGGKDGYVDYTADKKPGSSQFDFPGNYVAPELTIDGRDEDPQWADVPILTTFGRENGATVKVYRGEEALFFFVTVSDSVLLTEGTSNDDTVTRSDSVEIYIDSLADGGTKPQSDDYQINLGIHGKTRIMQGSGSGWGGWNGLIDYEVVLNGTLNDGMEATDSGYSVEIMIPYAQIGIEKEDTVGIAFAQVDKVAAGSSATVDWDWYGWTYKGVLCEPQTPNNYVLLNKDNVLLSRDEEERPDADITGYVKDYDTKAPLSGVTVTVEGTALTAVTDAQGYFAFPKMNPETDYTLTLKKDGYFEAAQVYTRAELRDSNGGKVTKDILLRNSASVGSIALVGTVENLVNGKLSGAKVSVVGGNISVTTGADGSFRIEDFPITNCTVRVEKSGYLTRELELTIEDLLDKGAAVDIGVQDLPLNYTKLQGVIADKSNDFGAFEGWVTRSQTGFEFKFQGSRPFVGRLELFVDTKTSAGDDARDTSDYLFNLNSDGTITIVNWGDGIKNETVPATMKLTVEGASTSQPVIYFTLPYEFFGQRNASEAVGAKEVIGISLGQWSDLAKDWDGWDNFVFLGANSSPFVKPEMPTDYIRIGAANEIYYRSNNEPLNTDSYPIQFGTGYNKEANTAGANDSPAADYFYAKVASRNASGVTFDFLTTGDFGTEDGRKEMVLVYFDTGASTDGWTNDYLIKIASDGTVYGKAGAWWSATDADKIGTVTIKRSNGLTTFSLTVSYDTIGVGASEVFGIAMREASHNDVDHHLYDPWWDCYFNRGTDIGTSATGIDAAFCTQYIRVAANGKLYTADSNG